MNEENSRMKILHQSVHVLRRAISGMRRRPWLHFLSTLTLAAAFLSFIATLTAAVNLNSLINNWVGNAEMTVYLRGDTQDQDTRKLVAAVKGISGVENVQSFSSTEARARFAKDLGALGEIGGTLPESAFPPSLDIHLTAGMSKDTNARHALAGRLAKVEMIEEVELYDDWFERLTAVSTMGRLAAWGLGLLAAVVSILVVAATVRTGVSARRKEIEVMRYVGATERFVRLPFLIEGALEASLAMGMALLSLHFMMNHVDTLANDIMPILGGGSLTRLTGSIFTWLLVGGMVSGLIGARLSLRKLEEA